MPITKSAQKALRQNRKRIRVNRKSKNSFKKALRDFKKKLTVETLKKAYSEVDKAVKKEMIHANKAARLKSQMAKMALKKVVSPAKKKE